jgi:hypothetical protein
MILGYLKDHSVVTSPVAGTIKASVFDADEHRLCLFIEEA